MKLFQGNTQGRRQDRAGEAPGGLFGRLGAWLGGFRRAQRAGPRRGRVTHVIIIDGTMSSLEPGHESNAGRTYRLLCEMLPSAQMSLWYEAGLQWQGWRQAWALATGTGLEEQICRAYGYLASHYRLGDRIFFFGYSRGAFAVRSLAGMIDRVGLLRADAATERHVTQAWRHYRQDPDGQAARVFAQAHCHALVEIEMVGVWDTVKALGLAWPLVWRLSEPRYRFHTASLGPSIRHGYHALAADETRVAFSPVLWRTGPEHDGRIEQVWFRGTHADVGGHLAGFEAARPLANIPLVWMLGRAEACGLSLPEGWRARFPCDPLAPSVGAWRGWGKYFWRRRRRVIGRDRSERRMLPPFAPGAGLGAPAEGPLRPRG